jgi:hypothetical protein
MAEGSNLVHPAQPGQSFLRHTELRSPCILWLSIDKKTLRYRSETGQCAVRCRADLDTDVEWLMSLMVSINGDNHIGWLFWLVNGYFASILHRKAGAGDAVGKKRWRGGRPFEKSAYLLVESPFTKVFSGTIQIYLSFMPFLMMFTFFSINQVHSAIP